MQSWILGTRVLNTGIRCLLFLLLIAPSGARAESNPSTPLTLEDRVAIRRVIEGQLAAFQRDDGQTALSYAAPEILSLFGTPDQFMRMVRRDYRVLYRPLRIYFKSAREEQGRIVQSLLATAEDGRTVMALYIMKRQPGGEWRIGGVVLVPTDQNSA